MKSRSVSQASRPAAVCAVLLAVAWRTVPAQAIDVRDVARPALDSASDTVELSAGSGDRVGDHLVLRGDTITYELRRTATSGASLLRRETLCPDSAAWRRLWERLDSLGVWEWGARPDTTTTAPSRDERPWRAQLSHAEHHVVLGPRIVSAEEHEALAAAFDRLLDGARGARYDYEPGRLEYEERDVSSNTVFRLRWEPGRGLLVEIDPLGRRARTVPSTEILHPSAEAWRRFWSDLGTAGAWMKMQPYRVVGGDPPPWTMDIRRGLLWSAPPQRSQPSPQLRGALARLLDTARSG